MNIQTKFDFGQEVYSIRNGTQCTKSVCDECNGSGLIKPKNNVYSCPKCRGCKTIEHWSERKWFVVKDTLTIACVSFKIYEKENMLNKNEFYYMCLETGVGSGTLHNESDLFTTLEEAQEICDIRNKSVFIVNKEHK
jgi:hypothetical protein